MEHLEVPLSEDDVPPAPANRAVKLQHFWPANPRAWLTTAKGKFELWGIVEGRYCFFKGRTPTRSSKAACGCALADGHSELEQLFNLPPLAMQVGQRQEIMSVDRLKAHIGSILVSPLLQRPPLVAALPRSLSFLRSIACAILKPQTGGSLWRSGLNIFFINRGVLLWRQ